MGNETTRVRVSSIHYQIVQNVRMSICNTHLTKGLYKPKNQDD